MSKQIAFRNSLAAKLFVQRIDSKQYRGYDVDYIASEALTDADTFVSEAINHQSSIDKSEPYEADDSCGSCTACDDEGYLQSRPGETFGAFLERVYADRDASIAKQAAQAKQEPTKPAEQQEIQFTTLKDLFEQLEEQLYARGVIKG